MIENGIYEGRNGKVMKNSICAVTSTLPNESGSRKGKDEGV